MAAVSVHSIAATTHGRYCVRAAGSDPAGVLIGCHGYAQEAMQSVIAFAGANGLRKLAARTHLGNRRSEVLLQKLGFTEEGLLRGHILKDGERRDCRVFGLLL